MSEPDPTEPVLIAPTTRLWRSFVEAMDEFAAEGRGRSDDTTMIGRDIRAYRREWDDAEGFARYVERLRADALEETPRPQNFVPSTTLWYARGDDFVARIAIRHRLTPFLLEAGGHIGYDVRPSARLQGHATAMLRAALPVASKLGIDPALITCDVDNVGSRKVIEAGGGELEDRRGNKLRFWTPTGTGEFVA